MARFYLIALITVSLICIIGCDGYYFPISTKLDQCCIDPVLSFKIRAFSGPCSCQTLEQKWKRYVDWVEKSGGFIHPWIELNFVNQYNKDKKFKMYSHERGMFANIKQKYRNKIKSKALLFQIPFSISFSQFIISKYIKNATHSLFSSKLNHKNSKLQQLLFPTPNDFMPDEFPDWDEFRARSIRIYGVDTIRGWLALGMAWIKENTLELLPWFDLLPQPYYLPILWDKFQRDKFLLTGTKALRIIYQLEREYKTATPYIEILGLTEEKVRESFAWITSRSFGMSLNEIGGAKRSPVIPCGIDFFNHNIFGDSSLFYDHSFGQNRFEFNGKVQNQEVVEEIILNNKKDDIIKEIDFASNYLWVNQDITNQTEIFVNYGKYHTSASRMALFGFIDEIHPYDHFSVNLDLIPNDLNYQIKRSYFKTVWNSTYTQQNKTKNKEILDEKMCYLQKYNISTWYGLGRSPRYYQNRPQQQKKTKKQQQQPRIYSPPLSMEYYGQKTIKIHGNFLRFLRLGYLPIQYFDSFTISSIINDFEYDYIENIIDPLVQDTMNKICKNLLDRHPTTYIYDQLQLKQIEYDRNNILKQLYLNRNKDLTETNRLKQMLSEFDKNYVVLKYKVREKGFLDKCSRLDFEATNKYLQSVKRNKFKKKKRKKKRILTSDGLQELLQTAFNFTDIITWDPRRGSVDNITVINSSNNGSINNDNRSHNVSFETITNTMEYEINYVELLKQIENVLLDIDIDGDIDIFDEQLWSNIIDDTTQSIFNNLNNNHQIDENEEQQMIQISATIINKKHLVIGEPKKAKKHIAETIGWNSPKAGIGGSSSKKKQKKRTFSFTNINNGEALDLSSLFAGNIGNIQINNGQIVISNNQQNAMNNNLNNLLSQFGLNNALQTVENNDNDNNDNNNNEEIPETVPFSQLMNSATVSVMTLDQNGNLVNVGNAMNNINLAQFFNNNRKKNKSKPKPKP